MNTYANNTKENKSQSIANAVPKKKGKTQSTFQFVDNRPEAVTQRKLREAINNSPKVQKLKGYQEMPNNSVQVKQSIQLMPAIQLQPAAVNYPHDDNQFVNDVIAGTIRGGQIGLKRDDEHSSILITIPFSNEGCQIHIHYKRELTNVVGSVLSNDRQHRYWLNNADAMRVFESIVPDEIRSQAERLLDQVTHGYIRMKNKTGLEQLMMGDYR